MINLPPEDHPLVRKLLISPNRYVNSTELESDYNLIFRNYEGLATCRTLPNHFYIPIQLPRLHPWRDRGLTHQLATVYANLKPGRNVLGIIPFDEAGTSDLIFSTLLNVSAFLSIPLVG